MTKLIPEDYQPWLTDLKVRIQQAQQRATLSVNHELVLLYWQIGNDICKRQAEQGWGAKVIDRLSNDLRAAFPEMKGFSSRNLKYMRSFAQNWTDITFVQEVLAQLPWYHQIALLDKLQTEIERRWYVAQAIEHGWSRNVMVMQIETQAMKRIGQAVTNFEQCLPKSQSDLAQNMLKDPYCFDFLGLGNEVHERDIENALVQHISRFLLELGAGFAFVGQQYHLEVGGDDFFIDLLFYHLKLRCYVVVELKTGEFKPEHVGQLGFYIAAVDGELKTDQDAATIGILLCKSKNKVVAEYALRDSGKALGVAEYQLQASLPDVLQTNLPTIEELEQALKSETVL